MPLALAQTSGTASTLECANYGAQASAAGVRTVFQGANVLPLTNFVEVGGPTASALVSPGISSAFAGAPYPGDTALSAISLVGGVVATNGGPGFDSNVYPLAAQSQFPTKPHAAVEQSGVGLVADSAELRSAASASGGGTTNSSTSSTSGVSTTKVDAACSPSDGLAANADTDNQAIGVEGGVVRVGRIHSEAHATIGPDGVPKVSAHLDVGQFTVAGQTVELSESNPGAPAQLPGPAADVMRGAGIVVRYLAAVPDADGRGVAAPGFEIAVTVGANAAGVGTTPSTVTYTFGRAYARADGALSPALSSGSATGAAPSIGGNTNTPTAPSAGITTARPATPAATPAAAPSGGSTAESVAATFTPPDVDWRLVYLALVLGGITLTVGGSLVRALGERLRWM
jgi:hypothetical protein